MNPDKLT
ncbi:hypothetical protein YPPY46_3506, partial [Yersinia pestis PY-46]